MSITDILNDDEQGRDKRIHGIELGVVTDIDDPDKLGRVKVKLLNRDTSNDETGFIRVMTPMTGKKWGMFFFPEVGDEVIVAFAGGDIARPFVLGSLWNQNFKPPVEIKDKKNNIRKIKTKNGNEIIFNDEDKKEYIQIVTPKKLDIKLDDDKEIISIKDSDGKNIVKIDSKNGMITIQGEKKINIKAGNSKVSLDGSSNTAIIESSQSIKLKSQQIVIDAAGTLDLKATGSVNVKADGPANIKGAVVKIN